MQLLACQNFTEDDLLVNLREEMASFMRSCKVKVRNRCHKYTSSRGFDNSVSHHGNEVGNHSVIRYRTTKGTRQLTWFIP